MREAARALDDVSDHLGEVLRRADELLAEWSQFGTQVRAQVEREVAAVAGVVDDAVARAAGAGIDRAVADRLRALTAELERLEQRTRAASRAAAEQRESDRRVLWIVVAGVVLANALLVVLLIRKPEPVPVAEPIRIESPTPAEPAAAPAAGSAQAGTATGSAADGQGRVLPAGSTPSGGATQGATTPSSVGSSPGVGAPPSASAPAPAAGSNAPGGANAAGAGSNAAAGSSVPSGGPLKSTSPHPGAAKSPGETSGARPTASPIALPPKGNTHHKKLP
jgi:hypothetical protein